MDRALAYLASDGEDGRSAYIFRDVMSLLVSRGHFAMAEHASLKPFRFQVEIDGRYKLRVALDVDEPEFAFVSCKTKLARVRVCHTVCLPTRFSNAAGEVRSLDANKIVWPTPEDVAEPIGIRFQKYASRVMGEKLLKVEGVRQVTYLSEVDIVRGIEFVLDHMTAAPKATPPATSKPSPPPTISVETS